MNKLLFLLLMGFQRTGAPVLQSTNASAITNSYHEDTNTKKFYGPHAVMSLLHQQGSIMGTMQLWKAAGYNVIWAHCDNYNDPAEIYYNSNLDSIISAAEYVGGIWIIPGFMNYDHGDATAKVKSMIVNTSKRPGVLHINGKPVYAGYNYSAASTGYDGTGFNQVSLDSVLLSSAGIHKKDYILLGNCECPYSEDNRATWAGEKTNRNGIKTWKIARWNSLTPGKPPYYYVTDLNHVIDNWPWLNGLITFGVDRPVKNLVGYNSHTCEVANRRNLEGGAWVGYSGFYASAGYYDYGYAGIDSILSALINMPPGMRPTGIVGATANDFVEGSYEAAMQNNENGLAFVPNRAGAFIGAAMRTPLVDHSGFVAFARPWIQAFLNNSPKVVFSSNEIFCYYQLHPLNAPFISTIPAAMVARGFNQAQWDKTIYKNGSAQVTGIKAIPYADDIRMAAHLTRPAYLKINHSLSALKPAGAAHFRIPLAGFTGTPVFSIIEPDGVTVRKSGKGPQPITHSAWPGGWFPLAQKL